MLPIILDNRMSLIARCVRENAVLADVGTDHGKLPVYLAQIGQIKRAVACDINEMPLHKAVNNIKKNGVESIVDTFLTNGLIGVEKYGPTDVVIAGMGGELIEQILREQTIDKQNVRYILQPMTREDSLRKYLCMNGYSIIDEHLVFEGKLYQIICAEYTGQNSVLTPAEALVGRINIQKKEPLLFELCEKIIKREKTKIAGKLSAGLDASSDVECLNMIIEICENKGE